jgi:hypothetical protein
MALPTATLNHSPPSTFPVAGITGVNYMPVPRLLHKQHKTYFKMYSQGAFAARGPLTRLPQCPLPAWVHDPRAHTQSGTSPHSQSPGC